MLWKKPNTLNYPILFWNIAKFFQIVFRYLKHLDRLSVCLNNWFKSYNMILVKNYFFMPESASFQGYFSEIKSLNLLLSLFWCNSLYSKSTKNEQKKKYKYLEINTCFWTEINNPAIVSVPTHYGVIPQALRLNSGHRVFVVSPHTTLRSLATLQCESEYIHYRPLIMSQKVTSR